MVVTLSCGSDTQGGYLHFGKGSMFRGGHTWDQLWVAVSFL